MVFPEQKIYTLIHETDLLKKGGDEAVFFSASTELLKRLTQAAVIFRINVEDAYTARIKDADPFFYNDIILNPVPLLELVAAHHNQIIYWKSIPERENPLREYLQALSSAVIIPMDNEAGKTLIVIGWNSPLEITANFTAFMDTARIRMDEIIALWYLQNSLQQISVTYTGILNHLPQAVVFINNTGFSGWINQKAAVLLNLHAGRQLPNILSPALAQLRSTAINSAEINLQAMSLFSAPNQSIEDWVWQYHASDRKNLLVCCFPVNEDKISGRLWLFEEAK